MKKTERKNEGKMKKKEWRKQEVDSKEKRKKEISRAK